MRKFGMKGYKVIQERKDGKDIVRLEPIKFYGRSASDRIRARKSKRVKVLHPSLDFHAGKGRA